MRQRTSFTVVILSVSFILFFLTQIAMAQEKATVEFFSPEGVVKNVRQVTVRFSEPMAALGDPHLSDPLVANCPAKGKGRWIDSKNWSYDFDRDLPAGLICEFTVKPGLKALSGKDMASTAFRFSTGGPAITSSRPWEGDSPIDEEQIFVLVLDTEVREESILKEAYFSVEGIKERVGLRLVTGEDRKRILSSVFAAVKKPSADCPATARCYKVSGLDIPEDRIILVQARQRFPASAVVKLVWAKGILSASGVATGDDQVVPFRTRDPFAAKFTCARENPEAGCIPVLPMSLYFSAPVPAKAAGQVVLKGKNGKIYKGKKGTDDESDKSFVRRITFEGPFPEKATFTLSIPGNFKDDAGRSLSNRTQFPLEITTHSYPALAKFSSRFGIIEAKGDRLLPVTVRNIEADIKNRRLKAEEGIIQDEAARQDGEAPKALKKEADNTGKQTESGITQKLTGRLRQLSLNREEAVIEWLRRVAAAKRETSIFTGGKEQTMTLPNSGGVKAFEVIGIPLAGAGFYVVEIESRLLGNRLLGENAPMFVPTAALVTNLSAHFKWGRESSLVWVTSLDKGTPVKGTNVSIRDCRGKVLWQGKTDARGIASVKKSLPDQDALPVCNREVNYGEIPQALGSINNGLFVFAKNADDMTFTHSSWNEGIEPWRFQLPAAEYGKEKAVIAHTILARNLLRAGETVHMKHILRVHTTTGFDLLKPGIRPETLLIEHEGSGQQYRLPLTWKDNGVAENTWKVPEEAKLGTYRLTLVSKKTGTDKARRGNRENAWPSGSLRVEEFRVPLMKGIIQPPVSPLVRAKEVAMDLSVSYFAGGGASGLPIRLRSGLQAKYVSFRNFEGFTFSGGPLKEGIINRASDRDSDEEGEAGEGQVSDTDMTIKSFKIPTQDLILDQAGVIRATISAVPAVSVPVDLHTEMEFRDPNGEIKTATANITIYPARRLIGIKPQSWVASHDTLRYEVAVVDLKGNPIPDAAVAIDLYQEKILSHRVRLVGGFYAYKNTREIKKIGPHFNGKTDKRGILICEGKAPVSGNIIIQARTADEAGDTAWANYSIWVAGKEDWWFEARNDDRIDVLPEKKHYEPGETARFQVRMPFREATVLVSVEREGIVDTYVKRLSGKQPIVEIPIKKNYAPNVFVSVLAVRGRVGGAKPTATFDPGRPSYKIGIGEVLVGWQDYELKVRVTPDRTVYKIRDIMDVRIQVRRPDGSVPPPKSEVALAAVDEGLLQLLGNDTWKILPAMMQRRPYEIVTSTAQAMVIGKRHFGLKALPHGGGGGRQITRELFDTLLLWKGRVILDDQGEANVKVPLNDSLTGFRIVAIATGGKGLFGTGEASIRTTQDLMILSGLPKLVREGDLYQAGFTVRNTSDRQMTVELSLSLTGKEKADLKSVETIISAGAAKEVYWPIPIPHDTDHLDYEIRIAEKGGPAADRLKVSQKVIKAVPVRTFQATLTQVGQDTGIPVEKPKDALSGQGGISVELLPALSSGLSGIKEYMGAYPYTCLEQKTSTAVALRSKSQWQAVAAVLPNYLDSDGLLKYFPTMTQGSDVLTAYVMSVTHEAGYAIPEALREKMVGGLTAFLTGRVIRYGSLPTADLAIRKVAAAEALSRYGALKEEQLSSIPKEPNLWPTSAVLDWIGVLSRLTDGAGRSEKLREAQQILRSRLNLQGTTMGFSTESMDSLWWLMASVDTNAVRAIMTLLPYDTWKEDLPRIATGALGRMKRGHWDTTVANAWGVLAMERFSGKFEAFKVSGKSAITLGNQHKAVGWDKGGNGKAQMLQWPAGKDILQINHTGQGAPWALVRAMAAIPLKAPLSSGFKIQKTLTPLEQKVKGRWSRGDTARVRLELESQSDMTWVVVNDPVPAGTSILRSDLGGSDLLTARETKGGNVWEAYTERSFEAVRVYYEYVPKGKWVYEYTLRMNNEGTFNLPATRVEALYAPEMFGEIPNHAMEIRAETGE
ncbi:MAG: hypothetical protein CSYNP_03268 [Syntrophus sp. SKADARSKE-3]|nr:hypothetical protein [Syntrophus sp. SKADARSKE-3]